jgi:hypothetical protein
MRQHQRRGEARTAATTSTITTKKTGLFGRRGTSNSSGRQLALFLLLATLPHAAPFVVQRQPRRSINTSSRRLLLQQQREPNKNGLAAAAPPTKARVRFSGPDKSSSSSRTATVTSSIDLILLWIASDVGSIALGLLGLGALLLGRLVLDTSNTTSIPTNVQAVGQATRSNLLAVFATGAVLLNGLGKLNVDAALAETVDLVGTELPNAIGLKSDDDDDGREEAAADWKWVLESLVAATPAKTAVLLQATLTANDDSNNERNYWTIQAMAGIVPSSLGSSLDSQDYGTVMFTSSMLDRSCRNVSSSTAVVAVSETYLPNLPALSVRTEFTFLPVNTQAVLMVPVLPASSSNQAAATTTVLVLGSNQARSFTPRDIRWCQTVATRLNTLAQHR